MTNYWKAFFVSLCCELENDELLESLWHQLGDDQTLEVCILRHLSSGELGYWDSLDLEFVASHFYEISTRDFGRIDIDSLREILSHSSLKIANEDTLFDLISSQFDSTTDYFGLLEYVRFEYLSVDCIRRFATVSRDHLGDLNLSIWARICDRLCLCVPIQKRQPRHAARVATFTKRSGADDPLDGIIAFLSRRCGGNVHDRGVVQVTSMSQSGSNEPKCIADLRADTKFCSRGSPGQWVSYEFRTGTVHLTGYAIRSQYDRGPGCCHLRDWLIETSVDGDDWRIVDKRKNNGELNDQNVSRYFEIREDLRQDCRFVRLRQTGKSHANNDSLFFSSFEVFGDLIE
jgi:hypothetical protein